jgi:hypothetical protein
MRRTPPDSLVTLRPAFGDNLLPNMFWHTDRLSNMFTLSGVFAVDAPRLRRSGGKEEGGRKDRKCGHDDCAHDALLSAALRGLVENNIPPIAFAWEGLLLREVRGAFWY